jgi:hypothetical protein
MPQEFHPLNEEPRNSISLRQLAFALGGGVALVLLAQSTKAQAQQALASEQTDVPDGSSQSYIPYVPSVAKTGLSLRGTTGSGEQDPVFADEGPLSATTQQSTTTIPVPTFRDTSDPVLQLQGRTQREPAQTAVTDPISVGTPTAKSNVAAPRQQDIVPVASESDPFAPTGLRIGSWRAFVTMEQSLGYSTNPGMVAMGDGGAVSQSDASVSLQSDWSRHSAKIDLSASLLKSENAEFGDVPSASAKANLKLDLIDGVSADLDANYNYSTESPSSSTITAPAVNRPVIHSTGISAQLSRTGHRLIGSLRGSVGRTDYMPIELANGDEVSQGDRNNTLYTATGRVGYEISPAITPFVELELGKRQYDMKVDTNGDERDSLNTAVRAGVALDLGDKLKGELAAGYRVEDFAGNDLETLRGLTVDGNLQWSPWRDTEVTFTTQTSFAPSTTSGQNGAVVNTTGVEITRKASDRLTLNANASLMTSRQDDGSRNDSEWTIGAGFNYWINRFLALTGDIDHVNHQSSETASTFDATTVRAGIKLQR